MISLKTPAPFKGLLPLLLACFILLPVVLIGQVRVSGFVKDKNTGEGLPLANVVLEGTLIGIQTDFDGNFELSVPENPPFKIVASYLGYETATIEVTDPKAKVKFNMVTAGFTIDAVEIKASRISEKTKQAAQTVESMDIIAIKETAAASFYDGLGTLKGVDQTSASIGFTIINTRGFNSTSPVRSLQTIDGVDNQAPGLNFSLGNFLGASELDVQKVDIVVGANSAYYGPNAFNGVISMNTRDPFLHQGLGVSLKMGERQLWEGAIRYAKAFKNKDGKEKLAFKINAMHMRANDWVADNYEEVYNEDPDELVGTDNPGGYDAVNIYGDESFSPLFSATSRTDTAQSPGIGRFHRTGYQELDIVDYGTRNYKASAAIHYKVRPKIDLILSGNYGSGTTVYQGDNRFSLKNLQFYQTRIELRQKDKFFIRAYQTQEDAGDTYDAYFTALKLLERSKSDQEYAQQYIKLWKGGATDTPGWNFNFVDQMREELGYPDIPLFGSGETFDFDLANEIWTSNYDTLSGWHDIVRAAVDDDRFGNTALTSPYLVPGTPEFQEAFDDITSKTRLEGGSAFYDKSALSHIHGEYTFTPGFMESITVGANFRMYTPQSRRTIFDEELILDTMIVGEEIRIDTSFGKITNKEFGVYGGIEKRLVNNKLKFNATLRLDKNENFDYLLSPAVSMVYNLSEDNILRLSFSSAIRNPTLTDQYLRYNVGRAILLGNINGFENLVDIDSFNEYRKGDAFGNPDPEKLVYYDVDPIQPEKVVSAELGYRTTLFKRLYLDGSYYFSHYRDFIGYNIGIDLRLNTQGFPSLLQVYRVAANAQDVVTTQGFSVGANYYFARYFGLAGNYSWNKLNTDTDDPIVPAFNTPEHKFNIGINGRNIDLQIGGLALRNWGFNINYKWTQGFIFEGSPQYTGPIDTYGLLDGQINYNMKRWNTTFKVGASNILNNKVYQVYGGPRVGSLAYFSISYELK